ncbi:MAG: hypothetical protein N4A72_00750 [Bacteroidales bacterium]|jgi:hypothetical protein|nr:hypothetical protein [Bacteroidales bacterium]
MITKDELQKLRDELPYGWTSIIAKKTGFTRAFVSQVLRNKSFNAKVINEAIKLRDETREELNNIKNNL